MCFPYLVKVLARESSKEVCVSTQYLVKVLARESTKLLAQSLRHLSPRLYTPSLDFVLEPTCLDLGVHLSPQLLGSCLVIGCLLHLVVANPVWIEGSIE